MNDNICYNISLPIIAHVTHIVAVSNKREDTMKVIAILLKYRADPQIQNFKDQNAIDLAKAQDEPDENVIEILSKEVQRSLAKALVDSPDTSPTMSKRASVVIGAGVDGLRKKSPFNIVEAQPVTGMSTNSTMSGMTLCGKDVFS